MIRKLKVEDIVNNIDSDEDDNDEDGGDEDDGDEGDGDDGDKDEYLEDMLHEIRSNHCREIPVQL